MKILVTGAGGFLGKEIAKQLVKDKHEVFNLSRNHYVELDELGIKTITCNLAKKDPINLKGFDAVIHCAAIAGVWGKKESFYKTNYEGAIHLFNMAKSDNVKYFIYTSTPSVVFGKDDIINGDESLDYPQKFYTHYAHSKSLAEKYILENNDTDMKSIAIRPHLIWGKGDPHIIPRVLERARLGKLKRVGNGDNLVDIVHVSNAALAHVLALNALADNKEIGGNAYFIGQEKPVNLWDFIDRILYYNDLDPVEDSVGFTFAFYMGWFLEKLYKILGIIRPEPPITRFTALQFAKNHYFSHEKARSDFGYTPIKSIDEGLEEAFRGPEYQLKLENRLHDIQNSEKSDR